MVAQTQGVGLRARPLAQVPFAEVKDRDFKLNDFKWLKDEDLENADKFPESDELATAAIEGSEGRSRN